jgi:hypothetical protein
MLAGDDKQERVWKSRTYPVPSPSRRTFRYKAAALRITQRFSIRRSASDPATLMVPPLYNFMPAENLALGWMNEIDALALIRQRTISAAKITGWDVFTFHTLHNADDYFDTTIRAIRETWVTEGILSNAAYVQTKRQFGKPYDYHRIHARLIENLVFQSSLLEWVGQRASDVPLRFHVIGTALLSALVAAGSISFPAAVASALRFGERWDEALRSLIHAATDDEVGWARFDQVQRLLEGRSSLSLGVAPEDLPVPDTPSRAFWYSPTADDDPVLISSVAAASTALETVNLSSWTYSNKPGTCDKRPRGWLVSPLHPMAGLCKWSISNYLLATPGAITLFLNHVATMGMPALLQLPVDPIQNRLRLSRMKVTGP